MDYLLIGLRGLLVVVFVVSAGSKLRGRRQFAEFVTATGALVPVRMSRAWLRWLAGAVVAAEVGLVALLLAPATGWFGFAAATGLLLAFTAAIVIAMRRGTGAACHCFGSTAQPVGPAHVIRNLALLAAAMAGLTLATVGGGGAVDLPTALVVAGAGGALALPVILADAIASLYGPAPTTRAVATQR